MVAFLSYWKCPLPYRSFAMLWGPICQFLILEHKPLVFCSGNFPLCPCAQGSSPLSFLLVSVYLVLCGGPWSSWIWGLYKDIRMDRFAFFYMLTTSWASTICWKYCHFPVDNFSTLVKDQVSKNNFVWVHFWVFNCIPLDYQSVMVPVLCSFYYNYSVVQLELRDGDSTRGSFIVENSFCYPRCFVIPDEFANCPFLLYDKLNWTFDGDCIESVDCFRAG